MSDLLAIVDADSTPEELVAEILRRHPDRVTLLVEDSGPDWPPDEAPRGLLAERLAVLRAAIEAGTGAVVVGLANSREQLRGWRFDRTIAAARPERPSSANRRGAAGCCRAPSRQQRHPLRLDLDG